MLKPTDPTALRLRYAPITPSDRQALALRVAALDMAIASPGAGGKTTVLLAGAAQYADVPGYVGIVARRRWDDMVAPGGIVETADRWFGPHGDRRDTSAGIQWGFPGGGRILLTHGDVDLAAFRWLDVQYVGIDEAQEFDDPSFYAALMEHVRPPVDGPLADVPARGRVTYTDHANIEGKPVGLAWVLARYTDPATRTAQVWPLTHHDNPAIDSARYDQLAERYGL